MRPLPRALRLCSALLLSAAGCGDDATAAPDGGGAGPCASIPCTGGGTCAVVGGRPICVCGDGRWTSGPSCAPTAPSSGCTTSTCAAGQACRLDTGECGATTGACGLPPAETGTLPKEAECAPDRPCAAGLVCVPTRHGVDPTTGAQVPTTGVCLSACDPCAPGCAAGLDCVALGTTAGGFCHLGGLRRAGDACPGGRSPIALCGGGTTCAAGTCVPLCKPRDPSRWSTGGVNQVEDTDDCGPGELCRAIAASADAPDTFVCHESTRGAAGEPCDAQSRYCEAGLSCTSVGTGPHGEAVPGVCSVGDCATTPCPGGVGCFDLSQPTGSRPVCVADGALVFGTVCNEDRNCEPPLVCADGRCGLP